MWRTIVGRYQPMINYSILNERQKQNRAGINIPALLLLALKSNFNPRPCPSRRDYIAPQDERIGESYQSNQVFSVNLVKLNCAKTLKSACSRKSRKLHPVIPDGDPGSILIPRIGIRAQKNEKKAISINICK